MSPIEAQRRLVPPSTLMHMTSRAPSCPLPADAIAFESYLHSLNAPAGAFNDLHQAPALGLAQRTGHLNPNLVALFGLVFFVMGFEDRRFLHVLAVLFDGEHGGKFCTEMVLSILSLTTSPTTSCMRHATVAGSCVLGRL